jgi:hypothetical protein
VARRLRPGVLEHLGLLPALAALSTDTEDEPFFFRSKFAARSLFRLEHSATSPLEGSPARSATPCSAAPLVFRTAAAPARRVASRWPCDRAGPLRDVVQVGAADRIVCHRTAGTIGIVAHLSHSGRHQRHLGSPSGQGRSCSSSSSRYVSKLTDWSIMPNRSRCAVSNSDSVQNRTRAPSNLAA